MSRGRVAAGNDDHLWIGCAALSYFVAVFAAGVVLGSVRVPIIEPRFGRFVATLVEAPLLIAAMLLAARFITDRFELADRRSALAAVGIAAVALVLAADFAAGLLIRQMSFGEQVLHLMTPAGLVYLLLLAIFAAAPLGLDRWRSRSL